MFERICIFDPPFPLLRQWYFAFWMVTAGCIALLLYALQPICGPSFSFGPRIGLTFAFLVACPTLLIYFSRKHLQLLRVVGGESTDEYLRATRQIYRFPRNRSGLIIFFGASLVGLYLMLATPYPDDSQCARMQIFVLGMCGWVFAAVLMAILWNSLTSLIMLPNARFYDDFIFEDSERFNSLKSVLLQVCLCGVALYALKCVMFWFIEVLGHINVQIYMGLLSIFPIFFFVVSLRKLHRILKGRKERAVDGVLPLLRMAFSDAVGNPSQENTMRLYALLGIKEKLDSISVWPFKVLAPALLVSLAPGLTQLAIVFMRQ